jgi:hypothetical protein
LTTCFAKKKFGGIDLTGAEVDDTAGLGQFREQLNSPFGL